MEPHKRKLNLAPIISIIFLLILGFFLILLLTGRDPWEKIQSFTSSKEGKSEQKGSPSIEQIALEVEASSALQTDNDPGYCPLKPGLICIPTTPGRVLGKLYFGGTVGYGRIVPGDDAVLSSSLLDPLLALVGNTHTHSGGLAYRGYLGFLVDISQVVALGSEVGFSIYPRSTGSLNGLVGLTGGDLSLPGKVSERGYGADLMFNLTFTLIPQCYMSVKPGIQFAYQKNRGELDLDLSAVTSVVPALQLFGKFRNTALLPEVIIATGWNFIFNRCHHRYALNFEISYQHVWGTDDAPIDKRVSSRDMTGAGLGFQF